MIVHSSFAQRLARYRAQWVPDAAEFRGSEASEPELLKFVPPFQRPAIELAAWLSAPLYKIAALRPADVAEDGIRIGRDRVLWCQGMPKRLINQLLYLRSVTGAKQRLFEGEKPLRRAAWDLRSAMMHSHSLRSERNRLATLEVRARLPDFLVLGVPRSATTWLYAALSAHPDVFVPKTKEQEFFGDYLYHFGRNWYLQHFAERGSQKIAGDVSVNYFNSPEAPKQIAEMLGRDRVKLIVTLREPIERARSYYHCRVPYGLAPRSFEEAISLPYFHELCIAHGHYARYLEAWYRYFDPSRLLLLLYEDIRRDPAASLRRVCSFLDVPFDLATVPPRENSGRGVRYPSLHYGLCRTAAELDVLLPGPPAVVGAAMGSLLRRLDVSICLRGERPYRVDVSPQTLKRLQEVFAPSNEKLAHMTGLDLSAWRYGLQEHRERSRPVEAVST